MPDRDHRAWTEASLGHASQVGAVGHCEGPAAPSCGAPQQARVRREGSRRSRLGGCMIYSLSGSEKEKRKQKLKF